MFRFINLLLIPTLSLALSACGGGGGESSVTVNGVNYNINTLTLSPDTISSSSGTTTVSVKVTQQTSSAISNYGSATVTFYSSCSLQGKASFSATTVSGGTYTSTYTNNGCSTTDTITASALVTGAEHSISANKILSITSSGTSSSSTNSGVIQLGYYNGSSFIPNVIYGGGSSTNIAANGSATLRVNLWDATNNVPYTTDVSNSFLFSSKCQLVGGASAISTPANLGNGVYTFTYKDTGCALTNAQNIITASTTVNGQSTNSATTTLGTTNSTSATVQMGSCTNNASCSTGTFTAGTLKPATAPLSAGGQTTIDGVLFDTSGNYYNSLTQITLSSTCATNSKATLSNATATNGQFSAVYKDNGCATTDTITATATVNGSALSASTSLVVTADTAGSIQFISATPTSIAVKGSGLTEQSSVKFQVYGASTAIPVSGKTVNFSLSTTAGGVTINPSSATTDNNGYVTTTVSSGTTPTPVRVIASTTVGSNVVNTQSSALTISTTLPDQPHFSLAATTPNPTDAWDTTGTTTKINVLLADQFSNAPPAGTVVNFMAESGQITSSCTTDANGACFTTWTSQGSNTNPPLPYDGSTSAGLVCYNNPTNLNNLSNQNQGCVNKAGRVSILAYVAGSEGFIDNNNDGIFNDGDAFATTPTNYATPPSSLSDNYYFDRRDLEPPYLDKNYNFTKEAGAANSGIANDYEIPNAQPTPSNYTGKYNGVLCQRTDSSCSSVKSVYLFRNIEIVMPTRAAKISIWDNATTQHTGAIIAEGTYYALIQDTNGNTMASGTNLSIATGTANNFTQSSTPPVVDKKSNYGDIVPFTVTKTAASAAGSIAIKATSGGLETSSIITVNIP